MTIEIRAYTPADLDRVMMVWRAATVIAHPFQGRVELDRDENLIRNQYMNLTESWCAWERDRLVGFISLLATRIVALFVDPACQRGGIGGRLLAHANEVHGPLSVEVFQELVVLPELLPPEFSLLSQELDIDAENVPHPVIDSQLLVEGLVVETLERR